MNRTYRMSTVRKCDSNPRGTLFTEACAQSVRFIFLVMDMETRTLCHRCRRAYEESGYTLQRTGNRIKSACDICGRDGFDYEIKKEQRTRR